LECVQKSLNKQMERSPFISRDLNSKINFSLDKAEKIQRLLSKRIIAQDYLPRKIRYVAGVDVSYSNKHSFGAVVVLEYPSMKLVEQETSSQRISIPYIPTFLAFREIPAAVAAARKIKTRPDIFLVDGHGRAHPRRFGLACHFGLSMKTPTIGVAKNILCGDVKDFRGIWRPIIDEGEVIGAEVFTKAGKKPVYVSVGHMISLETSIRVVLECAKKYRIPEPIRQAHIIAERVKRSAIN